MKKKILFIIGKKKFFYSLSQLLKHNKVDSYFLVKNFVDRNYLLKNGIPENKIYFLPDILNEKNITNKNKFNISKKEIKKNIRYMVKHSDLDSSFFDEALYNTFYKVLNIIDEINNDLKLDLFIMWNHHPFPANLIKLYCEKLNYNTLFFENGYFRPNTITVDSKGINYENSVPRKEKYYLNNNNKIKDNYGSINKNIKIKNVNFSNSNTFKNKYYRFLFLLKSLNNYYYKFCRFRKNKINFKKKLTKFYYKNMHKINKKEKSNLPSKYIFVPFQVHDDSQIINYSPNINNMRELVDYTYKNIKYFKDKGRLKDTYVIFKEHPVDIGRINYSKLYKKYNEVPWIIFLKKYNTKKLIKNSRLVITINSTVGIEALQEYKTVITLGQAFYNVRNLVINNKKIDNLSKDIAKALKFSPNEYLVDNFLKYLKFNYNIKGNWKKPTTSNIKFVVNEILKYIGLL